MAKKQTQKDDKKEVQKWRRKCFHLWAGKVREKAGKRCEAWENGERCEVIKQLNAHHIENFITNKNLRYDPRNGICLCPSHHKFKRFSAHKSFVFMYNLMTTIRKDDLKYLIQETRVSTPQTLYDLIRIAGQLTIPQLLKRVK